MRKNLLPKGGSIYMGVYLCCSNAFVTEKYLDDPQVCSAFKQCRSERMSQSMWTDCFLYSRIGGKTLKHNEYHGTGEMGTTAIKKDIILLTFFYFQFVTVHKPISDFLYCLR